MKNLIKLDDLSIGYRRHGSERIVATGINHSLDGGCFTCLLGPNGAGKSTLLRTLSGFQPPLGGDIIVDGKSLSQYTPDELAKVVSVVLTEKPNLSDMTIEEVIGLGRSPYTGFWGKLTARDEAIVSEAIEQVGIESLRGRNVAGLSDGERQKVMIAKALAQDTPIILLDEPTAFLDYPSKVDMMKLLHELAHSSGKSIFMSTHDLEIALQLADMVWLMDGRLGVTAGIPEDLALNGSIGRYFDRAGVEFDAATGTFQVDQPVHTEISVCGDGLKCRLLARALRRSGYKAVIQPEGSVVATDCGYDYAGERYATIAGLLSRLS